MRVVIAEDSVLLREGLTRLLGDAGFEVVAAVGTGEDLLRAVDAAGDGGRPHVAVVDVRMPPTHTDEGVRAALVLRQSWPDVAVLVLSQYVEERYAAELLGGSTRGVGYLLKDRVGDVEEFVATLRRVAAGGAAVDPEVVSQLLSRASRDEPLERLTPRELDVLRLVCRGAINSEIAVELRMGERTVKSHVSAVLAKLGVRDRAGAIVAAYDAGIGAS